MGVLLGPETLGANKRENRGIWKHNKESKNSEIKKEGTLHKKFGCMCGVLRTESVTKRVATITLATQVGVCTADWPHFPALMGTGLPTSTILIFSTILILGLFLLVARGKRGFLKRTSMLDAPVRIGQWELVWGVLYSA